MKKLDVVMTCTVRDKKTVQFVIEGIINYLPVNNILMYVPEKDINIFEDILRDKLIVCNEDQAIHGMTSGSLAKHPHRVFPRLTGWYYQQLLKLSYSFQAADDDYYLIWDADTVPLKPMEFFDSQGRMLITPAEEYNPWYFKTYRNLLGEDAHREYSFISQHLLVQKSVLREMLTRIEQRFPEQPGWPWAIMAGLPDKFGTLFSEYETYGHYLRNHYPERMAIRSLSWLREGTERYGFPPKEDVLERLSSVYDYVAFEAKRTRGRRIKQYIGTKAGNVRDLLRRS
jgi:hypothetical protein